MELLPTSTRKVLPALYGQEKSKDPIVYLKLFSPDSNWTWYVTEGSEEDGNFIFFGYVCGFEEEWGYFSLRELKTARGPWGLPIERDLFFKPTPFSKLTDKKIDRPVSLNVLLRLA